MGTPPPQPIATAANADQGRGASRHTLENGTPAYLGTVFGKIVFDVIHLHALTVIVLCLACRALSPGGMKRSLFYT